MSPAGRLLRVGLVCPYGWDIPGGVQAHVRGLATELLRRGHHVNVLTPASDGAELPEWCTDAGRPVPVPYNGSVARLLLGPVSAGRTRRWLRTGGFDLIHVHEPVAPSVALLACYFADLPVIATFHTANVRSRAMSTLEPFLVPALEKVRARIAVSEAARRTTVDHLGGDAVLIGNGVSVQQFASASRWPGCPDGRTVAFVGRTDEPRKGLAVLLAALQLLPGVRALVAGPGTVELPADLADRVQLLGRVSEADKASLLASADLYVAPNTGGESFGIVLLEAMAAGAPVVASDLAAFRQVLADGAAGVLFETGNAEALADAVRQLLAEPERRAALAERGRREVARYDWGQVAQAVIRVYETVAEGAALTSAR